MSTHNKHIPAAFFSGQLNSLSQKFLMNYKTTNGQHMVIKFDHIIILYAKAPSIKRTFAQTHSHN